MLILVPEYHGGVIAVERVQTGVRMERSLLKVLKGLAEYLDMSLGDLLEGVVLHAFEGKAPFSDDTLHVIAELKKILRLHADRRGQPPAERARRAGVAAGSGAGSHRGLRSPRPTRCCC